jgi:hypothetical protein
VSNARPSGKVPTGLELAGVVVRAFDGTVDLPNGARCILQAKTAQRAFRGECRTRKWCCLLTAFLGVLMDREVIALPTGLLGPDRATSRAVLFVAVAPSILCWDRLDLKPDTNILRGHFRYALTIAAIRLGALIGASGSSTDLISPEAAWLRFERRSELLNQLWARAGSPAPKTFAQKLGYDEETVASWLKRDVRPRGHALVDLGKYFEHEISGISATIVVRQLRWHYALSDIAKALSRVFGYDTVHEAAVIASAVANCVASKVREGCAANEVTPIHLAHLTTRSTFSEEWMQHIVDHAQRHGASEEFAADVLHAGHAWRASVQHQESGEDGGEWALVLSALPRSQVRRGRHARRTRRKKT